MLALAVPRRLTRLCPQGGMRFIIYHADKSVIENAVRIDRLRRRALPPGVAERAILTPAAIMDPDAVFNPKAFGHLHDRKARMGQVVSQLVQELILAEQALKPKEFIKHMVAEIDPISSGFQIRGVRVADNCAHCTIRWCCYNRVVKGTENETLKLRAAIAEILERVKPRLRHKIGIVLDYRFVPTVSFVYDPNVAADRATAKKSIVALKQIEEELKILTANNPD